jgi:hypothetical protein
MLKKPASFMRFIKKDRFYGELVSFYEQWPHYRGHT